MDNILLKVENLKVSFSVKKNKITVLDKISFDVEEGKIISVVGESGSGKSVTALSIMKILSKKNSFIDSGKINFMGKDLIKLTEKEMCKIRGNEITMIFQEPMTCLNPVMKIGKQIGEVLKIHTSLNKEQTKSRVLEVMKLVKIPDINEVLVKYPFELSGGMRQRVMIAMAICCNPKLIIADEPTTALDVTTQSSILRLLKDINKKLGTTIIFITHDLSVVYNISDSVVVMYSGSILEEGEVEEFFNNPKHPYSQGLIASIPENFSQGKFKSIKGSVPVIGAINKGCIFQDRCNVCKDICKNKQPDLISLNKNTKVRCFVYEQ